MRSRAHDLKEMRGRERTTLRRCAAGAHDLKEMRWAGDEGGGPGRCTPH
ncbi:hypothetical protein LP422_24075 [Janibacter limosus]|nr:hypothetical protein LP422_24075 [Janibacter limosus]